MQITMMKIELKMQTILFMKENLEMKLQISYMEEDLKLFRSPTEGNMIVKVMEASLTP